MKVKALITIVLSKDEEVMEGDEFDMDNKEAIKLSRRGFVQIVKNVAKPNQKGTDDAAASGKST